MAMRVSSVLKYLGLGVSALAALGALAWFAVGGAVGIAESSRPAFPDWPEPRVMLGYADEGELYFATNSPYDFDILLRQKPLPVPTTGVGTLILPPNASASDPVPAVVLVHGSGGIKPGREMRAGQTLADAGIAAFVIDYYGPRSLTSESDYLAKVLAVKAAAELAKPALAVPSSSLEARNGPA